jgi:hypothetical protein
MNRPTGTIDPAGLDPVAGGLRVSLTIPFFTRSDCGGAEFWIGWDVVPRRNGWIIQHIKIVHDIEACDGTKMPMRGNEDGFLEWWEAWEVVGPRIYNGSSRQIGKIPPTRSYGGHDSFRTSDQNWGAVGNQPYRSTRGRIAILGYARFMKRYKLLNPPWLPPNHHMAPLPYLPKTEPAPFPDADGLAHVMQLSWDCCCAPPVKTHGFTIPSSEPKR